MQLDTPPAPTEKRKSPLQLSAWAAAAVTDADADAAAAASRHVGRCSVQTVAAGAGVPMPRPGSGPRLGPWTCRGRGGDDDGADMPDAGNLRMLGHGYHQAGHGCVQRHGRQGQRLAPTLAVRMQEEKKQARNKQQTPCIASRVSRPIRVSPEPLGRGFQEAGGRAR